MQIQTLLKYKKTRPCRCLNVISTIRKASRFVRSRKMLKMSQKDGNLNCPELEYAELLSSNFVNIFWKEPRKQRLLVDSDLHCNKLNQKGVKIGSLLHSITKIGALLNDLLNETIQLEDCTFLLLFSGNFQAQINKYLQASLDFAAKKISNPRRRRLFINNQRPVDHNRIGKKFVVLISYVEKTKQFSLFLVLMFTRRNSEPDKYYVHTSKNLNTHQFTDTLKDV